MDSVSLYNKHVLKNGLTVLTVPIDSAASVTMTVLVKAGSRYEKPKENGISHFLEHLHFKGTKLYPTAKKLSEAVDSIGGEFNANTGKEHTQYYIRAAYEHLPLVFNVLTDMIQNPLIESREIEREKGVIIEEINMYRDNPQIQVESLFEENMWPDQALGRDIAGTAEKVRAMTREDIFDYRKRFYQPGNMIVAVAGKFDDKLLNSLIEKNWGGSGIVKDFPFEPGHCRSKKPYTAVQEKATEQAHMMVGFKGFSYKHKHNQAQRILATILGGGMSSRLFIRVRERLGLAYYVSASANNYLDSGSFTVQAGLKVDKAPEALTIILEELKRIAETPVKAPELKKAKEYIKGKIALTLEDPHDKLEWYLGQEAFLGKIRTVRQTFDEIDEVDSGLILATAQEIIRNDCLNLAVIGPYKSKEPFEKRLNF
ncbi:MAG: M16 family metallopeptidase [Acidobacteriaceae bacterium]